jgi:ABC-type lipoprotein export system ATPase subunit
VTHDQDVAEAGDRIVRMRDGRIESDGASSAAAAAGRNVPV